MTSDISLKVRNMGIVCAMLVAFIHVGRPIIIGSGGWWFYQLTAEGVCRIAVPFFFICSGMFLARHFEERGWWKTAIRRRFKSIVVPYFLWSLLFYLFVGALYVIDPTSPQVWRISGAKSFGEQCLLAMGLNMGPLPMLYPLWYLRALFVLVLISPLLLFLRNRSRWLLLGGSAVLYLLFNTGDGSLVGVHVSLPFEGVFYFCCGLCIEEKWMMADKKVWTGVALSALLICLRAVAIRYQLFEVAWMKPIFIMGGLVGVWSLIPSREWPKQFVSLSFLVYVLHVFGLQLFSFIWGRDFDNLFLLIGRVAFGLVFALAAAHVLHNLVGKRLSVLWGGRT